PHLRETWKSLGDGLWLWHIQTLDASHGADAAWLYRLTAADGRVKLIPYRPLDATVAKAAADAKQHFKFDPAQWAELVPCTQAGVWKGTQFSAAADAAACSALLPGLGESAALLPLRFTLDGDLLTSVT